MSKPFFYRLNASDLFSIVRELSDKECSKWLRTFASDLVAGNTQNEFTQSLIDEAVKYKESKSLAGKKGMERRYQNPNSVITELQQTDNTDITNSVITSNRSSNNNSTETTKDKVKRFVPPSLLEVETYITEKNYPVDPVKWFNHYSSNGWKVGKNKMVSWHSAVATWLPEKPKQAAVEVRKETPQEHKAALQRSFLNSL